MSGLARRDLPRVAKWLQNFPPKRRDAATLLIDGLTLVSETDLRRDLDQLIVSLVETLPNPVAAFLSREVAPEESAHGEGREGGYPMFDPGYPGSEAVVGNIVAAIQRRPWAKGRMLGQLDLDTMRQSKARTILLVDDFSGSGKRLLDFERALRRHPTIRSWASYKLITFHVVLYAATDRALSLLRRRFGEDCVHVVRPCPTFATLPWTAEQLAEVEGLCLDYGGVKKKPFALGFQNSRAMIAFEHTAPNNLPFVLWRIGDAWNSLFELKYVPPELLRLFTMAPGREREPQPGSDGAERLGQVLDRLSHRVSKADRIASDLEISMKEARRLLKLVLDLDLVDAKFKLTDNGWIELRRWRGAHAIRKLPNNSEAYYPRQLRAGQ